MNIFVTDDCPIQSARNLCDQHCRSKMIIESAIMLAHAFPQEILDHPATPRTQSGKPRKSGKGYFNHVCSIWVRESRENFIWLVEHALEMFRERMYRWPDSNEHFTKNFIKWCQKNIHNTNIYRFNLTKYAVAISDEHTCRSLENFDQMSITDQYRAYIRMDKPFATWTVRNAPSWYGN